MCATCGCDQPGGVTITKLGDQVFKPITPSAILHQHPAPALQETKRIELERDILGKNNRSAKHNRFHFEEAGITALNIVSVR